MTNEITIPALCHEHELIAQAMLQTRGNLEKASRYDAVGMNCMALRIVVKDNPGIRVRYHELLAEEMQEKGLHIAERILAMADMQAEAFGGDYEYTDPDSGEVKVLQRIPDPATAVLLSKEISRLILEGKSGHVSSSAAILLTSKEDAAEILQQFLDK